MIITPFKLFLTSPLISRYGRVSTVCVSKRPNSSVPLRYIPKTRKTSPELCSEGDSLRGKDLCLESNEYVAKERVEKCSTNSLRKTAHFPVETLELPFDRHENVSPGYPTPPFDEAYSDSMHYEEEIGKFSLENRIDASNFKFGSAYCKEVGILSRGEHHGSMEVNDNNIQVGMRQSMMMDHASPLESPGVVANDSPGDSQVESYFDDISRNEDQAKPTLEAKLFQKKVFAAKNCAINMLSRRSLTAAELTKKLGEKGFPSDCIEKAILELQTSGLQSDNQYAEGFASSKWQRLSWGPMRIKKALTQRGVDKKLAEEAVSQVFLDSTHTNEDDTEFENERWGMSKTSVEHLLCQARKQWFRGGDIPDQTRKRRLIGWLQRRGFSWKVITEVFKNLENAGISGPQDNSLPFDFDD